MGLLPSQVLVMNQWVKMRIKWREVIHALGRLIGLLSLPFSVCPGDLCYDGGHDELSETKLHIKHSINIVWHQHKSNGAKTQLFHFKHCSGTMAIILFGERLSGQSHSRIPLQSYTAH